MSCGGGCWHPYFTSAAPSTSRDLLGSSYTSLLGNQLLTSGPKPHPSGPVSASCQGPAGCQAQVPQNA